jgi:acyl-CoA synthetase (AMP-forming)/AMP-acid ligase II
MKAGVYNRRTLTDLLLTVVKAFPDKGIGFVQPDGSVKFMTYPELLSRAKAMIPGMIARGLAPGDKMMIVMTRNEEIIPVLWACFLSGYIPTILQPPVSFNEFNQPARKIENVYSTLKSPKVIISADLLKSFHSDVISSKNLITTEDLKYGLPDYFQFQPKETDIAFIQFSSGSTGDPKGIILTHKNILPNLAAICAGLDVDETDVYASWLPLYHDMGLFAYHICPILAMANQYLIDTIDFIKKPALWLDIIDKTRSTISGCPNFGQVLLLRYLKNREDKSWDLSSLKAIVNGAEPISNRIMSDFMNRLFIYNLRKESMMPAYGMAEATLGISFAELSEVPLVNSFNRTMLQKEGVAYIEKENAAEMTEMVSVGKAINDTEIRVVDEEGHQVEDTVDGNIEIRGVGVTSGYYNNPAETRNLFDKGWLRTGDKGFFFEGNLYITGRTKDIIFVRGQNLYAHDLENLAGNYSDIRYGKVVIGGLFDPKKGQDLIILFLVGSANQAICETVIGLRNFFRDTYGISIEVFVPIRSNQVPKTSSGKIQRYKLISSYQNGEFDDVIAELKKLVRERELNPNQSGT